MKLNYFSRLEPDEGRDLLVARHIALFGDNLVLGHDASGIEGLFYGPYYYYLLAFFNLINDNPYFIFFLISIWHSLSTIFVFLIGKNFINKYVGLIFAVFYAFSSLIIMTNNVWGAYQGFQIFILSFLFFSFYYRYHFKSFWYIHIFFFTLAFAIQYSNITILPLFIFWSFLIQSESNNLFKKLLIFLKIILIYIIPLIITFIPQIIYFKENIFSFISQKDVILNFFALVENFNRKSWMLFDVLFYGKTMFFGWIFIAIFIIWYLKTINPKRKQQVNIKILIFGFITGFIISSFKITSYAHNFLHLYLLFFLVLASIIENISENIIARVLLTTLILSGIIIPFKIYHSNLVGNQLKEIDLITNSVIKKLEKNSYNNIFQDMKIIQNSNIKQINFYPAPELYLFLERKLKRKLVNVGEGNKNFFNIINLDKTKYILLICRLYSEGGPYGLDICLKNFRVKYKNYLQIEFFYNTPTMKGYLFVKN